LQWLLQQVNSLSPYRIITNKIIGSIILMAAGIFQFTPLKQTCLNFCSSPLEFIYKHWKEGKKGAIKMGIENGSYCVGCCWILMVLLFVSGVMNILWVALIGLFILIEKIFSSNWVSYVAGIILTLCAATVMIL
jgi:predicted metal-binding membrane protein